MSEAKCKNCDDTDWITTEPNADYLCAKCKPDKSKPTYDELTAENSRLRKAIEEVEPPECQYPNLCKASHGHIEVCKYIEFQEWKRNALEGK